MASMDTLKNRIRQYCPTAPQTIIRRAIISAARELCEKALVWREYVADVTLNGASTYTITPPANGELVGVLRCRTDGDRELIPRPRRKIQPTTLSQTGTAEFIFTIPGGANKIGVAPNPDSGTLKDQYYAFMPTENAVELDPYLERIHERVIMSGALSILLRMPDKPWQNFRMAEFYTEDFDDRVATLAMHANDEDMKHVPRAVKYGGL